VTGREGFCDEHRKESFRFQKQFVNVGYKERNRFYQRSIWKRLRADQLSKSPLCKICRERGVMVAAAVVDHIIPFVSVSDPLALDADNLQSLCLSCHSVKTRRDGRGRVKSL
jgi:5-methylcytosine-specific restriction endonuclease McrA